MMIIIHSRDDPTMTHADEAGERVRDGVSDCHHRQHRRRCQGSAGLAVAARGRRSSGAASGAAKSPTKSQRALMKSSGNDWPYCRAAQRRRRCPQRATCWSMLPSAMWWAGVCVVYVRFICICIFAQLTGVRPCGVQADRCPVRPHLGHLRAEHDRAVYIVYWNSN